MVLEASVNVNTKSHHLDWMEVSVFHALHLLDLQLWLMNSLASRKASALGSAQP